MMDFNSVLVSISVVSVFISVLSLCFPDNKYRPHLIMMSKIIIVSIIIASIMNIEFDFEFISNEIATESSVFNQMLSDRISNDIDSYIESVYDTHCRTQISDSEVILSVTNGDVNIIRDAVYEKFGIKCKVIKIE